MPEVTDERTVHQRIIAIINELPAIDKTQKNVQQNFMFRGHDDVLNALNPLLAKHGVIVVPNVLDRVVSQRSTAKGSIMFEVNLHVEYAFYGAGGDVLVGSTWGEGTDMGDKATSKAMTMAFKSMLNQAFAISNKEVADADGQTAEESVGRDRVVKVQDVQPPRNWTGVNEIIGGYGDIGWKDFARQASIHLFDEPDGKKLDKEQGKKMLAVTAQAAVNLVRIHPSDLFPPPTRLEIQTAWAQVPEMEGHVLTGPSEVLSPDETTLDQELANGD